MTTKPTLDFSLDELRLFQAQQILAENLNVPLRILRGDCLTRLERSVPPDDWKVLSALLAAGGVEDLFTEELPGVVDELLTPEDQVRFDGVSMALWKTPVSAPNPFYEEVKDLLPPFQARVRLNLLRCARRLWRSSDERTRREWETLNLPAGFVGLVLPLDPIQPEGLLDLLVVGPARLLAEGAEGNRFVHFEQETHALVRSLEPQTAPLNLEDKINLLVLSSAYAIYGMSDLEIKAAAARRTFRRVRELEEGHRQVLDVMSTAEWTRLVHFVFFWQSKRTLPLLEHCISTGGNLKSKFLHRFRPGFSVATPLSYDRGSKRTRLIQLRGRSDLKEDLDLEEMRFEVGEEVAHEGGPKPEQLKITLDAGQELPSNAQEQLTYFFHRSIEDGHANRAWQEYLSFDRLRHRLQHLPVDDAENRTRLFTERARELVMADVAAYLEFDSLEDRLVVGSVSPAAWVDKNDLGTLNDWLKKTAEDESERQQSAVYRCLATKSYVSRLVIGDETHPFAVGLEDRVAQIPADAEVWGIRAEDLVAVPVQFHDRILGVLYLISKTAYRFRYYDRIRLLSFVRMFEAELFEARLFTVLREMNEDLGSALREEFTQAQLCERLMFKLARLLGASGAALWWRSPTREKSFEVLGYAGERLSAVIRSGHVESSDTFPVVGRNGEDLPVTVAAEKLEAGFEDSRAPHALLLPLPGLGQQTMVGVVSLHDSAPIVVSDFLRGELEFVRDEIGQNLSSYMGQHQKLQTIRDLIGHDLGTALKNIDSSRRKLWTLRSDLPQEQRERYELRLSDVESAVDRARQLLDLLTRESLQWELLRGEADFSAPYRALSQELQYRLKVGEVVNESLVSKDLTDRNISFSSGGREIRPLWLDASALGRIFTNLADNVAKYGKAGQRVKVQYDEDEVEFFVRISSLGHPLRAELRSDPDRVFERGVRGAEEVIQQATEGEGQGLFASREIAAVWQGRLLLEYEHGEPWARYTFTLTFPRWLAAKSNPWR